MEKEKIENSALQHLEEYCKKKGWGTDKFTLKEILTEATRLQRKEIDERSWWKDYSYVVKIDNMLIRYLDAESTGDEPASEMGYEFDITSITEVKEIEKQTLVIFYWNVTHIIYFLLRIF